MARAPTIGVVLIGDKALERKLRELSGPKLLTIVSRATQRAMKPVIADARQRVSRQSGTLARSLGAKTKKYPAKGVVMTIVGPRAGMGREVTLSDGRRQFRDPIKYSHLIEKGHRIARKGTTLLKRGESVERGKRRSRKAGKRLGKSQGVVPAHPFILPAFTGKQSAIIATYRQELAAELAKEAARKANR